MIDVGMYSGGMLEIAWDGLDERGSPVAPGVYFLRAESGGYRETLKVVVIQ